MSAAAVTLVAEDKDMTAENLVGVAGLLADRSRASICLAMLDGRAWTIGELARHVGVAPSTASEHVTRLAEGGLIEAVHQGRHTYVRLASSRTADLIEDLASYSAKSPPGPGGPSAAAYGPAGGQRSLRAASTAAAMARARTCYDHLAGLLGVRVTDAMTDAGFLDQASGFALTGTGVGWLAERLGIDVAAVTASRRPVARPCLDWTERRPHLGGAAGAAICDRFFALGWITRIGTSRAVRLSDEGRRGLPQSIPIDLRDVA
jgi:DNA-binding transcriptional ArsR family regulator